MALKKDKQKVLGEVFDDERIKTFLDYEAYGDTNPSFHSQHQKGDDYVTVLKEHGAH